MPLSEALLEQILNEHGVVTRDYGKGEAKAVGDLLSEIEKGKSRLCIDNSGAARVTNIAKISLLSAATPQKIFMERTLRLPAHCPSPEAVVLKYLERDLHVTTDEILYLLPSLPAMKEGLNWQYPGLTCLYLIHSFRAVLRSDHGCCQEAKVLLSEEQW